MRSGEVLVVRGLWKVLDDVRRVTLRIEIESATVMRWEPGERQRHSESNWPMLSCTSSSH